MPLTKVKDGSNMYQGGWVTHTHSHLGGACYHGCTYCYVQAMAARFPSMKARYSGPVRVIENELRVNYGSGKTIFIEHMNDFFASGVSGSDVGEIWDHLARYPNNIYVFQSKDPIDPGLGEANEIRDCDMIGTTIESNRGIDTVSAAPHPMDRAGAMADWKALRPSVTRFLTIEPIMDFDLAEMVAIVDRVDPLFVNIGADSKGSGLIEPSWDKIQNLIGVLKMHGYEIRRKSNLDRLAKGGR